MPTRHYRAFRLATPVLLLTACAAPAPQSASPTSPPQGIDLGRAAASPRAGLGSVPAAAAAASTPASGGTAHASHHAAAHPAAAQAATAAAVPGHGTIEAVDLRRSRVTLKHDPMPAIGWPAMTMVFQAPPTVNLGRFKVGDHVDFTLLPAGGGAYDLGTLTPSDH